MKALSIILTALLFIPVISCSIAIFQIFYQTSSDLIPEDVPFSIARPSFIYAVSFLAFLIFSIFLNVKEKFKVNILMCGCLMLAYLLTINFIGSTGLG